MFPPIFDRFPQILGPFPQKYWEFPRKYLNKIKGKRIYNSGKSIKKIGNFSKFEFRGISEKFEEIAETPQKNRVLIFEGFPRIFDLFPC